MAKAIWDLPVELFGAICEYVGLSGGGDYVPPVRDLCIALLQHAPDGSSKRLLFSRKRVIRAESSNEVPRLVGVIEDAGYVALRTEARGSKQWMWA